MAEVRDSGVLRADPLVAFAFRLDLDGTPAGFFTEASGLGSETEVVEQLVSDDSGNQVILKIPGREKWQDITLKRGITKDMELWDWRETVMHGDVTSARRNGSITMMDSEGTAVAQWDFRNAWPSKVTGPSLKVDANELGVEEITVVHEGIWRVS